MNTETTDKTVPYAEPTSERIRPAHQGRPWKVFWLLVLAVAAFAIGITSRDAIHSLFHGRDDGAVATSSAGKQLWTCGMHPQVIRDKPGICPICHMKLTPVMGSGTSGAASQSTTVTAERKVRYWWDPMMNPPYISQKPGKSPMGMDLVPVYEDEVRSGPEVRIDPVVMQNMGVRVQPVAKGTLRQSVRAVGYLEEPEPLHRDINLRVSGWIEKLYANVDGMQVKEGEPLFDLYSPEVQVAVEELIAGRRSVEAAGADAMARKTASTIYDSTRQKLILWGLSPSQVDELAKRDKAPGTIPFLSPMTGHVTEKTVVEGAAVQMGQRVLRLASRHEMWIDAQVYERQLALVKPGLGARANVAGLEGRTFEAKVTFIHPHVDPVTRTALVRLSVPNADQVLRQGMYATVEIAAEPRENVVTVPAEAVIDTGTRQLAFVALGDGHFEPRDVKLGTRGNEGQVQVTSGLAPGEQVVTSGQFLLDSESRLREAIEKHLNRQLASNNRKQGNPPETINAATTQASPAAVVQAPTKADHSAHSAAHQHAEPAATTAPAVSSPSQVAVDRLATEYLKLSAALGAPQSAKDAPPLKLDAVIQAASALGANVENPSAAAIEATARAMAGKPLRDQREQFASLSDAVISFFEATPPSKAVGENLVVAKCAMALNNHGANWVQVGDQIANPYFPMSMKSCGEILRTLPLVSRPQGG